MDMRLVAPVYAEDHYGKTDDLYVRNWLGSLSLTLKVSAVAYRNREYS